MNTNRLNIIDVAKGIGIILVVFAHVNYTPELLTIIYSFHMPLFFLISGMLFDRGKYSGFISFVKKKFKSLMIPYVIYECVSIACLYLSERVYDSLFDVSKEEYIEYFKQIIISNWSGTHVNQPLWFVPCLFLVEILYYFISKMQKGMIIPVCTLFVTTGWILESGILEFDNFLLPWSMDSAFFALGFYAIGNLMSPFIKDSFSKIKKYKYKKVFCVELIVIMTLILIPLAIVNGKITLGTKILNNGFLLYINGVLGTMMILVFSILFEQNRFLKYCGKNSFQIMASHYSIRNYIVRPAYKILKGQVYDREILRETIVPFICVFVLSLLYTVIYNKVKKFAKNSKMRRMN